MRIHGDGMQTRPFINVDTLAEVLAALPGAALGSQTWNLATHNASILDIVEILQRLVPDLEYLHLHRDMRMQRIAMALPLALAAELAIEVPRSIYRSSI